jgi:hypothetical protein
LVQLSGVGAAGVPPLVQIGAVLAEDAFPAAGSVAGQQFLRAGGAGEAAHGVAGQAEDGGSLADGAAVARQSAHLGVTGTGPVRDPPCSRCLGSPSRLRRGRRLGSGERGGLRRDCDRQVLAVAADRPLDGLAEVVPQVSAVGDLNRPQPLMHARLSPARQAKTPPPPPVRARPWKTSGYTDRNSPPVSSAMRP